MLRSSVGTDTADPRLILINFLRIAHTALDTPIAPLSDAGAAAIRGLASLMGVDPNDPAVTFVGTEFPDKAWYPDEDRAAFPLTGVAMIGALAWFLWKGPALRRTYAACLGLAWIAVAASVAWQPWVNRLVVFLIVLGAPAAGVAAAALARHLVERRRKAVAWSLLGTFAAIASLAGLLTVAYGFPRRLTGAWSVFTVSDLEERFIRRREWLPQYEQAAAAVADSGAETVGIVQGNDSWEYPWWILLPDGTRLVALESVVPGHPGPTLGRSTRSCAPRTSTTAPTSSPATGTWSSWAPWPTRCRPTRR
ncbi:hypothetical protein GCM10029992_10920 [Glycomyces albus]